MEEYWKALIRGLSFDESEVSTGLWWKIPAFVVLAFLILSIVQ